MVFAAAVGAIGAVIPQQATTSSADLEAWKAARPLFAPVVTVLGLDRVFSTWWFLAALALFTLALAVATARMLRAAAAHARRAPASPGTLTAGAVLDEVVERAMAAGYRPSAPGSTGADGPIRLTRHRLGWWAPALMHVGMLIAILAALLSAAYTSRCVIDLSEGEIWSPGGPLLAEESGILAASAAPDQPLRLDGVKTGTWATGEIRTLRVDLSVGDGTDGWRSVATSINRPLRLDGRTVYASPGEFGEAAYLVLTDERMPGSNVRMEFPFTAAGTVSYSDITPAGWPTIQARWDPDGVRGKELLTLRIIDATGAERRVGLDPGQTATLGTSTVRFAVRGAWARLIVVRPFAVSALFFGFAVIGVGSLMLYLWVPREIVLAEDPDGVRCTWRAARMGRSYADERDAILGTGEGVDR